MTEARSQRRRLTAEAQVQSAVVELAESARRSLALFTHALEPAFYDQLAFLEAVKRLVLAKGFARVRILLVDPTLVMQEGHRLVELGRKLSSFVEFRRVHPDFRERHDGFAIADERSLVHLKRATYPYGVLSFNEPDVVKRFCEDFELIWGQSPLDHELRRLHI